ncbi:MAG TPA: class I SAM-dependent methyltransferase [Rudaea sp.]|nr:class I SAM-dependent methyltransferase [Rudaea sp.]
MNRKRASSTWSYDAIADVYATDMGQSMPFDDVAWYRSACLQHAGPVLELGCGTGRILLELLAAGIDAIGADRSLPMLQRLLKDAAARNLPAHVVQTDLHAIALSATFGVILAPYSLITYLVDADAAVQVLRRVQRLLAPDGVLAVDAFVPQPVASFADFRLDYRRTHGARQTLERHKRITVNPDGSNRIERRYRLGTADGGLVDEFLTEETIRPYTASRISELCALADLVPVSWCFDYGTRETANGARFATGLFRRRTTRS